VCVVGDVYCCVIVFVRVLFGFCLVLFVWGGGGGGGGGWGGGRTFEGSVLAGHYSNYYTPGRGIN